MSKRGTGETNKWPPSWNPEKGENFTTWLILTQHINNIRVQMSSLCRSKLWSMQKGNFLPWAFPQAQRCLQSLHSLPLSAAVLHLQSGLIQLIVMIFDDTQNDSFGKDWISSYLKLIEFQVFPDSFDALNVASRLGSQALSLLHTDFFHVKRGCILVVLLISFASVANYGGCPSKPLMTNKLGNTISWWPWQCHRSASHLPWPKYHLHSGPLSAHCLK